VTFSHRHALRAEFKFELTKGRIVSKNRHHMAAMWPTMWPKHATILPHPLPFRSPFKFKVHGKNILPIWTTSFLKNSQTLIWKDKDFVPLQDIQHPMIVELDLVFEAVAEVLDGLYVVREIFTKCCTVVDVHSSITGSLSESLPLSDSPSLFCWTSAAKVLWAGVSGAASGAELSGTREA